VENAGVENAGVDSMGGKRRSGKCRSDNRWKAVKRRSIRYQCTVVAKSLKTPKFETSDLCERLALSIPRRIRKCCVQKGSQQNQPVVQYQL